MGSIFYNIAWYSVRFVREGLSFQLKFRHLANNWKRFSSIIEPKKRVYSGLLTLSQ